MEAEGKSMRAVQYDKCGGGVASLKHVEVPVPTPKKGYVLLKLQAIALTQRDGHTLNGELRPTYPWKFPYIPGFNAAGQVVEVGPEVTKFQVGDDVVALLFRRPLFVGGGLAEYAVTAENRMAARPPEVSAAEAACLPLDAGSVVDALTDSADLKLDGTDHNKSVLITGASSGMGYYAVQLAKLGNMHVTATCETRDKEFVYSLGADEVLEYPHDHDHQNGDDHNNDDVDGGDDHIKSPSGRKYDAVLHCSVKSYNWSALKANLSEAGKVVEFPPYNSLERRKRDKMSYVVKRLSGSKKRLVWADAIPRTGNLKLLVGLAKEWKLRSKVDSIYSLRDVEAAWTKLLEGNFTGHIIVEP